MVLVFVATEDSLAAVASLKFICIYFNLFFDVTTDGLLLDFLVGKDNFLF